MAGRADSEGRRTAVGRPATADTSADDGPAAVDGTAPADSRAGPRTRAHRPALVLASLTLLILVGVLAPAPRNCPSDRAAGPRRTPVGAGVGDDHDRAGCGIRHRRCRGAALPARSASRPPRPRRDTGRRRPPHHAVRVGRPHQLRGIRADPPPRRRPVDRLADRLGGRARPGHQRRAAAWQTTPSVGGPIAGLA